MRIQCRAGGEGFQGLPRRRIRPRFELSLSGHEGKCRIRSHLDPGFPKIDAGLSIVRVLEFVLREKQVYSRIARELLHNRAELLCR